MASRIVGRADCPECGFKSAHVKESEKCLYRYCPECGAQHYAKTDAQRAHLMAKTRPTGTSASPSATATATGSAATSTPPSATPTLPAAAPPAAAKRHGLGLFQ